MVITRTLSAPGGRTLQVYDSGSPVPSALTVFWHHGTPNVGAPPEPLLGWPVRWLSYDRPGYGGSSRLPGRNVAQVARDVAWIAGHLQLDRFAVMGHSGGGPHALACAALLPSQVVAAVSVAGLAPHGAPGLAYFEGMYPGGRAELEAATQGEAALAGVLAGGGYDPEMFTPRDHQALGTSWQWLHSVVGPALEHGPGGMIDDDLAYVRPWGFAPGQIQAPVLLLHGEADRIVPVRHAAWLAAALPRAELHTSPDDGHISILDLGGDALDWLIQGAS
jgi:pimeloyl-ACP methyl ester carboxylesterase